VTGTAMNDNLVRKLFRRVLRKLAVERPELGIDPDEWTPRDLRHMFVSLMSEAGVPIEAISREVGHKRTGTTETVYWHELKPRRNAGAKAMDNIIQLPVRKAS
jgi:integrase